MAWSAAGASVTNEDLIEIGRGGASRTDGDSFRLLIGDGAVPVGFGVINNDGELVWALGASVEASRKAHVGNLDVTLTG
jgi:hypothetical protein